MNQDRGRITARVSAPVMDSLQEAADLTGSTLNQFLVQAALEKAQLIIDREHMINITRADATMLLALLDNPPKPNEALTRAFARMNKENDGVPDHELDRTTRHQSI